MILVLDILELQLDNTGSPPAEVEWLMHNSRAAGIGQ